MSAALRVSWRGAQVASRTGTVSFHLQQHMTTKTCFVPDALDEHLSSKAMDRVSSLGSYLERGAEMMTPEVIAGLREHRAAWRDKIEGFAISERLRHRVELLAAYFDETSGDDAADTPARREIAFALLYFLKGADRIPDLVPTFGFLDDAIIVQLVLQRQVAALRAHWLRRGRLWPAEL